MIFEKLNWEERPLQIVVSFEIVQVGLLSTFEIVTDLEDVKKVVIDNIFYLIARLREKDHIDLFRRAL